jgi:hypothetical protein
MRTLVILTFLTLASCGYGLGEDPEMEAALYWARDFKAEHPELSRTIAKKCEKELTSSPYFTRSGSLQLFQCIRREAEALGYA